MEHSCPVLIMGKPPMECHSNGQCKQSVFCSLTLQVGQQEWRVAYKKTYTNFNALHLEDLT